MAGLQTAHTQRAGLIAEQWEKRIRRGIGNERPDRAGCCVMRCRCGRGGAEVEWKLLFQWSAGTSDNNVRFSFGVFAPEK